MQNDPCTALAIATVLFIIWCGTVFAASGRRFMDL